jgi:dihydroxy-acid dehydratase
MRITRCLFASLNKYSKELTQICNKGGGRAMLYGAGMTNETMQNPFVGIGSMNYDVNPCNRHLSAYQDIIKQQLSVGFNPIRFNTVGISDGLSMGTNGMNFSLPSRELIADSIETFCTGMRCDSVIMIPGCDKNLPGSMMGLVRLNRPGMIVYGGSIQPGKYHDEPIDIVTAFASYGMYASGEISIEEREDILKCCCPGVGSCGGMYTANTMAILSEVLGLSVLNTSSNPALSPEKMYEIKTQVPYLLHNMLINDIKPMDILTKESFLNAIRALMAIGGSTNSVIHLIAIANEARIKLDLSDFERISKEVPVLCDVKPFGKYHMHDIHMMGGTKVLLKYLLDEGIINGETQTIYNKSLGNILTDFKHKINENIVRNVNNPIKPTGHISILKGNLAPDGCVTKFTGNEKLFTGPARVFNSEQDMVHGLELGQITSGDVVIIRYQGPKESGMPEMLIPTTAINSYGLDGKVALLTDGRFSGGSSGFIIGHISPEAYDEGDLSIIKNDDIITIDPDGKKIFHDLSDKEIKLRHEENVIERNKLNVLTGYLQCYRQNVLSAAKGCIMRYNDAHEEHWQ